MKSTVMLSLVAALLIGLAGCSGKPAEKKTPKKPDETVKGDSQKSDIAKPDVGKEPAGPTSPLDLAYLTDDMFAAVVVHPGRIAKSAMMSALPQDELLKEVNEYLRLDPRNIDRAMMLLDPGALGGRGAGPYVPSAVLRFSEPVDAGELLEGHDVNVKEETIAGKACLTSQFPRGITVAIHVPDDRTVVFAEKSTLGRMLAAGEVKSPLADRLAKVDAGADLIAVVTLGPVEPMIAEMNEAAEQGARLPVAAAMAVGIAEKLTSAVVAVDLSGDTLVRIELDAKDAQSAEELDSMAKGLVDMGKVAFDEVKDRLSEQMPPAMAKPILKLADDFINAVSVGKSGNQVLVKASRPEGAEGVIKAVTPMLLQAVDDARNAAKRVQRMNNLKQIALAMHNYNIVHDSFPAAASRDKEGKPLLSWRVAILPYLEEEALYKQFKLDEPWDSEHNKKLVEKMPEVYKSAAVDKPGMTAMMVFTGEGTPFGGEKGPTLATIRDGTSNTIMFVEAGADKAVAWTRPADLAFDKENPIAALGNIAGDSFLAAFCDGSVHAIKTAVDAEVLRRLIQHADGQPVGGDKF